MANPAGNPPPLTGSLRGKEPFLFTGDKTTTEDFMREFEMYEAINSQHELFAEPYNKVILFLTLMRGPNVNDWKAHQLTTLQGKINHATAPIARTDNVLWTDARAEFMTAFTNATAKQSAHINLLTLKMIKDDLDTYITRFMNLAMKAGFDITAQATAFIFYQGLPKQLISNILRDNPIMPVTVTQWITAAKKQQQRSADASTVWNSFNLQKWNAPNDWNNPNPRYNQRSSRRHPNDETVPMDTGAVAKLGYTRDNLSPEQKKKYRTEGRCFHCGQQNHMARQCPKKQSNKSGNKPQFKRKNPFRRETPKPQQQQPWRNSQLKPAHARIATIEEIDEPDEEDPFMPTQSFSVEDLAMQTAQFTEEQKMEWVEAMKREGVDFQET